MRIGELAKLGRVNVQTLRFYERSGLLAKPARSAGGYRVYGLGDLHRVQFIKSCQLLGFTLKDVKEVLALHRVLAAPASAATLKPAAQARFLAAAKRRRDSIDEKLALLRRMKKEMTLLVAMLEGRSQPVCPVSGLKAY